MAIDDALASMPDEFGPVRKVSSDGALVLKASSVRMHDLNDVDQGPLGGGGGLALSYVGRSTVAGNNIQLAANDLYCKKVVFTKTSLITSIEAYLGALDGSCTPVVAVLDDNAGVPGKLVAVTPAKNGTAGTMNVVAAAGGRWLAVPVGKQVPAGTFWIGFGANDATMYVDGAAAGAADYRIVGYTANGGLTDVAGANSAAAATGDFTIRASILS